MAGIIARHFSYKMNIMNIMIPLLLCLAMLQLNYSQNDSFSTKLRFHETEYDFGMITNNDTIEHIFEFQNTSNSNISIMTVSTSCRCTSTQWSKSEIESQKEGKITVIFSTKGHSGYFKEYIHVYFSNNEHHVLTISGSIDEQPIQYSSFSLRYLPLLVEKEIISFGLLNLGEHQKRRIILYNPTVSSFNIKFWSNSEMLKISNSKDILFPFDTSTLIMEFIPFETCPGHKKIDATYSINDTIIGSIPVNAKVIFNVENQSSNNFPKIQLPHKTKTIKYVKKTIHKWFTIRNTGNQTLHIYAIYTDSMIKCNFSKQIKPGRRTRVKVVLDVKGEERFIPIEIYSNARNAPLEKMILIISSKERAHSFRSSPSARRPYPQ